MNLQSLAQIDHSDTITDTIIILARKYRTSFAISLHYYLYTILRFEIKNIILQILKIIHARAMRDFILIL